jgi:hypothetical protein
VEPCPRKSVQPCWHRATNRLGAVGWRMTSGHGWRLVAPRRTQLTRMPGGSGNSSMPGRQPAPKAPATIWITITRLLRMRSSSKRIAGVPCRRAEPERLRRAPAHQGGSRVRSSAHL